MKKTCPGFYDEVLNVGGAKTDWFIPSKDELFKLEQYLYNVQEIRLDLFKSFIWSSSSVDANRAYFTLFGFFVQEKGKKKFANYVYPVRAFG